MPESLAATPRTNESLALLWLALSLTEGLGPKRGRNLVEHLGGVQDVFKASLTELEAAGIRAVSALATGQSADLAQDELARAMAAAAHRGAINAKGQTVAIFGTGVWVEL